MRAARFTATLLDGHKGAAVEVPFDPAERWGSVAVPLRKGRKGHRVRGSLDGVSIESAIVARSGRFFLLVDEEIRRDAGVRIGDLVVISIAPETTPEKTASVRRKGDGGKILTRIRSVVASLPETSEKLAWGAPTFRVREKMFAMYLDDHHGDGRVALWCKAPPGAQEAMVAAQPEQFFIPPYVGKGGWIGIHLDRGLEWSAIAALLAEAWRAAAPKRLAASLPSRSR